MVGILTRPRQTKKRQLGRVAVTQNFVDDNQQANEAEKAGNGFAKSQFDKRVVHRVKGPGKDDLALREPMRVAPEPRLFGNEQAAEVIHLRIPGCDWEEDGSSCPVEHGSCQGNPKGRLRRDRPWL